MLFIFACSSREVRRSCDPSPTAYVETRSSDAEPSVVFCLGLHPIRTHFDLALAEEGFWNHLNGDLTRKIRLIEVQASEFPSRQAAPSFLPKKLREQKHVGEPWV